MIELFAEPAFWASIALLVGLEVVLGADNVVFISLLASRVAESHRKHVLRIGLALAAGFRLVLLLGVAWILGLERAAFDVLGWSPSWREIILAAGGIFLIYKAVSELHQLVEGGKTLPAAGDGNDGNDGEAIRPLFAILQIVAINAVFSVDSIITAIGVSPYVEAMAIAVVVSVVILYFVADWVSDLIQSHPSIEALALGFLLLVGMLLVAQGLGMEAIQPYLYGAFGLAAAILGGVKLARHYAAKRAIAPERAEPKREPLVETPEPVAPASPDVDGGLGGAGPVMPQSRPARAPVKRKITSRQKPKKKRDS